MRIFTKTVLQLVVAVWLSLGLIVDGLSTDLDLSQDFYRQSLLIPSGSNPTNLGDELRNSHIPGGIYRHSLNTWRDCVQACVVPCSAVDFDETDFTCWHHYGLAVCGLPKVYHVGVTHYRTVSCLSSGAQPAPPPTILGASGPADVGHAPHDGGLPSADAVILRQIPIVRSQPAPPSSSVTSSTGSGATCGRPAISPLGSRIIGGDESRPRSWPWQIALRNKNARSSRCAGSLIAPQWVLTTAHCVDQDPVASNWLILTGAYDLLAVEPGRVAHSVAEVIIHDKFNLDTFDSDIALLRLTTPVSWSPAVSPVCLPPPDFDLPGGSQCVITGWGVAAGGRRPLKQAGIPIVPMETCRRSDWLGSEFTLTDRMMCAGYENGGVDTCQGDSGGPLVCFLNNHWVQVGVTSFGRGCGLPQKPGVYAKVSRFIRWIQNVINRY